MTRAIKSDKITDAERADLLGAPVLDPDALDAAILGSLMTDAGRVLVYGYQALVEVFAKDFAKSEHPWANACEACEGDAQEWVHYNTIRALPYMGPRAPVVIDEMRFYNDPLLPEDEEALDDMQIVEAELVSFAGKKYGRP